MTGDRRGTLTGVCICAAAAAFSVTITINAASAMPASTSTVPTQAGLSVEKVQFGGPRFRGPAWRGRRGPRRVCFWRFGRRVCVWR